ncbi:hypothetical protein I2483_09980 [Sporosarcina sp. E16_3]|nr:hypothetical protein [Sporosarcina sp. E16_3]MBO0601991.1 hypothetical protein [Sporosarcina sp. E16_3]
MQFKTLNHGPDIPLASLATEALVAATLLSINSSLILPYKMMNKHNSTY